MIGKRKGGYLMPVLLFTACGTLIWMVASMMLSTDSVVEVAPAKPAKVQDLDGLAAELQFAMPPASHYDAILDRPIFSSSRRAVAQAAVAPTVVVSRELKLKLQGTSIRDTDKHALFMPKDGGEALRLREGEDYQGWTLARIKNSFVVFRRKGAEERLEMDFVEPPAQVAKRKRNRRAGGQDAQRQTQRTLSRTQQGNQAQQRNKKARDEDSEGEEDEDQQ